MARLYYILAVLLAAFVIVCAEAEAESYALLAQRHSTTGRGDLAVDRLLGKLTFGLYGGLVEKESENEALAQSARNYGRWAGAGGWVLLGLSALFLGWHGLEWRRHGRAVGLLRHLLGVSLVFLLIGLTAPILTVAVQGEVPVLGPVVLSHEVKGILALVWKLLVGGSAPLGALLFLFSVLTPVAKLALSFLALGPVPDRWRRRALQLLHHLGKWSMTDVFVVAVLVAFLGLSPQRTTDAAVGIGLYFFAGYGLLSLVATQLLLGNR